MIINSAYQEMESPRNKDQQKKPQFYNSAYQEMESPRNDLTMQ